MTPPAPTLRMEALAFTVSDPAGPRLVVAREGATWTVYRVTISTADDGATGRHLDIIRDGVRPERLPAVLIAIVNPSPQE